MITLLHVCSYNGVFRESIYERNYVLPESLCHQSTARINSRQLIDCVRTEVTESGKVRPLLKAQLSIEVVLPTFGQVAHMGSRI